MTVILDYGMGNLRSVERAVRHLGFDCVIQPHLKGARRLILPGVGAFGAAMQRLEPLSGEIGAFVADGSPLLGICLGQQLLFQESEEHGRSTGLSLLPGTVRYLPPDRGLKVPHIGWNGLVPSFESRLMKGVAEGEAVYFVHSLYTACADPSDVAAEAEYIVPFAAAVERENVFGVQFHPEKSGETGLKILRNFLQCS
ncbi:MAG TPA: imidazole glycerol phosphate synthase subunit HisH [Fimbriimonadaceae bacterium]|nr:imidazole glycerol phosphate synthase subunit HisH [Fimbriimonadaceae bacterium]